MNKATPFSFHPSMRNSKIWTWKFFKDMLLIFFSLFFNYFNLCFRNVKISSFLSPRKEIHNFFSIKGHFSSVQSLSHVWLFATPWIAARQASLSITNSWSSLRLTSIESESKYFNFVGHVISVAATYCSYWY